MSTTKVFWIMGPVWGSGSHKCFFRLTQAEAQHDVDYRLENGCTAFMGRSKRPGETCDRFVEPGAELPEYPDGDVCDLLENSERGREFKKKLDEYDAKMASISKTVPCPGPGGCLHWPVKEWSVLEEDMPDSKLGVCCNDRKIVAADNLQCGVGSVRAMRDCNEDDDGRCRTCSYWGGRLKKTVCPNCNKSELIPNGTDYKSDRSKFLCLACGHFEEKPRAEMVCRRDRKWRKNHGK